MRLPHFTYFVEFEFRNKIPIENLIADRNVDSVDNTVCQVLRCWWFVNKKEVCGRLSRLLCDTAPWKRTGNSP